MQPEGRLALTIEQKGETDLWYTGCRTTSGIHETRLVPEIAACCMSDPAAGRDDRPQKYRSPLALRRLHSTLAVVATLLQAAIEI